MPKPLTFHASIQELNELCENCTHPNEDRPTPDGMSTIWVLEGHDSTEPTMIQMGHAYGCTITNATGIALDYEDGTRIFYPWHRVFKAHHKPDSDDFFFRFHGWYARVHGMTMNEAMEVKANSYAGLAMDQIMGRFMGDHND